MARKIRDQRLGMIDQLPENIVYDLALRNNSLALACALPELRDYDAFVSRFKEDCSDPAQAILAAALDIQSDRRGVRDYIDARKGGPKKRKISTIRGSSALYRHWLPLYTDGVFWEKANSTETWEALAKNGCALALELAHVDHAFKCDLRERLMTVAVKSGSVNVVSFLSSLLVSFLRSIGYGKFGNVDGIRREFMDAARTMAALGAMAVDDVEGLRQWHDRYPRILSSLNGRVAYALAAWDLRDAMLDAGRSRTDTPLAAIRWMVSKNSVDGRVVDGVLCILLRMVTSGSLGVDDVLDLLRTAGVDYSDASLCTMCMSCWNEGKTEIALDLLWRIRDPSEVIYKLRKACGTVVTRILMAAAQRCILRHTTDGDDDLLKANLLNILRIGDGDVKDDIPLSVLDAVPRLAADRRVLVLSILYDRNSVFQRALEAGACDTPDQVCVAAAVAAVMNRKDMYAAICSRASGSVTAVDSPLGMGILSDPDRIGMFTAISLSAGEHMRREESILTILNNAALTDDRYWTFVE